MFFKTKNNLEKWLPEAPSPFGLLGILSDPMGGFMTLGTKFTGFPEAHRPSGATWETYRPHAVLGGAWSF